MLIDNISMYKDIELYECENYKEYLILLRNGLTPIYVTKTHHYFLKDEKLMNLLGLKK